MKETRETNLPVNGKIYLIHDNQEVHAAVRACAPACGAEAEVVAAPKPGLSLAAHLQDLDDTGVTACIVIDLVSRHGCGLLLQERLRARGVGLPLVFVTGQAELGSAMRAMRSGAVDYLTLPLGYSMLSRALHGALAHDGHRRGQSRAILELRARFDSLTERERQVMELVAAGALSKQAAYALNLCEITVKIHRAKVMRKMSARTLVDLVRMNELLMDPSPFAGAIDAQTLVASRRPLGHMQLRC